VSSAEGFEEASSKAPLQRNAEFALMARDILDYIRRDMTHPNGGIYSAEVTVNQ